MQRLATLDTPPTLRVVADLDVDAAHHWFRTLLADLGTLTANTMRVADGDATFTLLTEPTPVQQRSVDLLGVTLCM